MKHIQKIKNYLGFTSVWAVVGNSFFEHPIWRVKKVMCRNGIPIAPSLIFEIHLFGKTETDYLDALEAAIAFNNIEINAMYEKTIILRIEK